MNFDILIGMLCMYGSLVFIPLIFGSSKTIRDYFVANKNLSWFELTGGQTGIRFDFYSLLLIPGLVAFNGGLHNLGDDLLVVPGMLIISIFLAKYIHQKVFIYNYFDSFYKQKVKSIVSLLFIAIRSITLIIILHFIASWLNLHFSIPPFPFLLIHLLFALGLVYFGGIKPGIYFNLFVVAFLFAFFTASFYFGILDLGGWDGFISRVDLDELYFVKPNELSLLPENTSFYIGLFNEPIVYAIWFGLDYSCQIILSTGKSIETIKKGVLGSAILIIIIVVCLGFLGLITKEQLLIDNPHVFETHLNAFDMFPLFWKTHIPPIIIGLFLGVFCLASISSTWNIMLSIAAVVYYNIKPTMDRGISDSIEIDKARKILLGVSFSILAAALYAMKLDFELIDQLVRIRNIYFLVPFSAFFVIIYLRKRLFASYFLFFLITVIGFYVYLEAYKFEGAFLWVLVFGYILAMLGTTLTKFFYKKLDLTLDTLDAELDKPFFSFMKYDIWMIVIMLIQIYLTLILQINVMNI